MREIELILEGEPLPKQSVRQGKGRYYQDPKYKEREAYYRKQVEQQTPPDWQQFTEFVYVTSLTYVHFPPQYILKHKRKKRWLDIGGLITKPTKPDLIDNSAKLILDSLGDKAIKQRKKIVGYEKGIYKDDAIIIGGDCLRKYWGVNPRVEITLVGV